MKYSDFISTLALVVSVCVGIANYWYTRRNFAFSHYVPLQVSLKLKPNGFTCTTSLSVYLKNLSSSISITDIRISIYVAHPNARRRLWRKQRLNYCTDYYVPNLGPQEEKDVVPKSGSSRSSYYLSIEGVLVSELSGVLQKERSSYDQMVNNYRIFQDVSLPLSLRVKYQPALLRARPRKVSQSYELRLLRKSQRTEPTDFINWDLR